VEDDDEYGEAEEQIEVKGQYEAAGQQSNFAMFWLLVLLVLVVIAFVYRENLLGLLGRTQGQGPAAPGVRYSRLQREAHEV